MKKKIQTMSRDGRVNVIHKRVAVLDLFPEMALTIWSLDPDRVGFLVPNIIRDREQMFRYNEFTYQVLRLAHASCVFLFRPGKFQFGEAAVPDLFDFQQGSSTGQFHVTNRLEGISGVRHESDVLDEPVVLREPD